MGRSRAWAREEEEDWAVKLRKHVLYAIDDAGAGRFDSALMNACIAIDPTSKKLYPGVERVGKRYVRCLRDYYWLLEPMMGAGMNLVDTRFENVPLPNNPSPDFAELIYRIFRCHDAHGDEIPLTYSVTKSEGNFLSHWAFSDGELHMPDRVVFALLAVAVFSRVNADVQSSADHWLALGDDRFPIRDWWGREDEFRQIADYYNQTRVKIEGLKLPPIDPEGPKEAVLVVKQPYME
jgi:hypothetical protein